jgi:CO dehydrogenase maturation factor
LTTVIAVAGKGGTGKTTLLSLLMRCLVKSKAGSVLAIDADPASNLNLALGCPLTRTVGDVREDTMQEIRGGKFPVGMNKYDYLDYHIQNSLVETPGYDLLAMGRPEGPGCYCAANNVLRMCVDRLSASYDYVLIDNEAGMEHLSRRTTQNVDVLFILSNPSVRDITVAKRLAETVTELQTKVGRTYLVLSMVGPEGVSAEVTRLVEGTGLEVAGSIPRDPQLAEFESAGRPLVELPDDNPVVQAVAGICDRVRIGSGVAKR